MTDREKLIALFTELGIGFEYEEQTDWYKSTESRGSLVCLEGRAKIDGYGMFFADFQFDENGKFIKMGVWE